MTNTPMKNLRHYLFKTQQFCSTQSEKKSDTKEPENRREHVVTVIVHIIFVPDSLPGPVKTEKANQYCHSQLQIKLSLLLLPPCSFFGHLICRNSDKRISIDCW